MYKTTKARYGYLNEFMNMIGIFKPIYKSNYRFCKFNIIFLNQFFLQEFKDHIVLEGESYEVNLLLKEQMNLFFSNMDVQKSLVAGKIMIGQQKYILQGQKMKEDMYCISFFMKNQVMLYPNINPRETAELVSSNLRDKIMKLEVQNQELRDIAKAKANFLIDIDNSFLIILNEIISTVRAAETEAQNPQAAKIKTIRYVEELKTMTEFVSSMAKFNTEIDSLYHQAFDVKRISDFIYDYLTTTGGQHTIKYEYEVSAQSCTTLLGDESRLKIVLKSLGDCVMRLATGQEVLWRIRELSSSERESELEFYFGYTGGMPNRLSLFKGEVLTSEGYEHLLVSLKFAITKQLAAVIGGTLVNKSHPEQDSGFKIKWKFKKINRGCLPFENEQQKNYSENESKVVLYVDDSLFSQDIMEKIIKRRGYKYIAAFSGQEAINIIEKQRINLVFLDLYMPEINGYETAKIIRDKNFSSEELPIIGMTAYTMKKSKEECLAAGMNDYLEKPFELEHLYKLIDKYLMR